MLPDGWIFSTVGKSCSIKNYLRLPLSTAQRATMQGKFPYFGPTGVLGYIDQYRIDEEFALIGEDGDHFLKFKERPMTLLVNGKANVNNHAHVIADSKHCLAGWFYFWFMHRDITPVLTRQGVGRYKLTKSGLEGLQIAIPPLDEQRKVIQFLNVWQAAITNIEHLLANSRKQKHVLSYELLNGRMHLGRFIPWAMKPISQLIKESRVVGSGGNEARKLTVKLYAKGVVKSLKRLGSESTQYYRRFSGQFIYSKLDFINGAFGLIPSDLDGFESTLDLPAFDFLPDVDARWFFHFISREEFYRSQLGLANGGRKARRVNPKELLQVSIAVPCLEEQRAIAGAIDGAAKIIRSYELQLQHLRTEKSALMQQLLTGKRRVKGAPANASEN